MSEAQEQAGQRAAVMLAFAEGKEIEFINHSHSDPAWTPIVTPAWDWRECDYRVKLIPAEPAKPREWWIWNKGEVLHPLNDCKDDYERERHGWKRIRVVEVPPGWSDPRPPEGKEGA